MKSPTLSTVVLTMVFALAGCSKNSAQSQKERADSEAKLRAEAERKEMETLPKVFRTPDYFKKNDPSKTDPAQPKLEAPKK